MTDSPRSDPAKSEPPRLSDLLAAENQGYRFAMTASMDAPGGRTSPMPIHSTSWHNRGPGAFGRQADRFDGWPRLDDADSPVVYDTDPEENDDDRLGFAADPYVTSPKSLPSLNKFAEYKAIMKRDPSSPRIGDSHRARIKRRYRPGQTGAPTHNSIADVVPVIHKHNLTWRANIDHLGQASFRRRLINASTSSGSRKSSSQISEQEEEPTSICSPNHWFYKYIILFFTCVLGLGSAVFYDIPAQLPTNLKAYMGIDDYQLGLLYSVYDIPNTFMVILGGILVDKLGLRRSTTLFSLLVFLGSVVFSMASIWRSYWMLLAGRLIFGLGGESVYVAQDTITAMWFQGKFLAMAMGLTTAAARIGDIFSQAVLPRLVEEYQPPFNETIWLSAIGCGLSLAACMGLIYFDRRAEQFAKSVSSTAEEGEKFSLAQILSLPPQFWLLTLISVTYYSCISPFLGFANDLLQQSLGYSQTQAGLVTSIVSIASLFGSPLLGLLIDTYGQRAKALILGNALLMASFLLLSFTPYGVWPAMGMIGIGYSFIPGALWPCVFLVVENHMLGTAWGIASAALNTGNLIVYYYSGQLINDQKYFTATMMWSGLAGCGVLLSILYYIIDTRTGGLANLPSKDTVKDSAEEEPDEDEETSTSSVNGPGGGGGGGGTSSVNSDRESQERLRMQEGPVRSSKPNA